VRATRPQSVALFLRVRIYRRPYWKDTIARYTPKWVEDEVFAELKDASDRAVISVGGAYVEYALEEAFHQPPLPR
jgi:hypothetical protein